MLRYEAKKSLFFFATGILGYELKAEVHRPGCEFMQERSPLHKLILMARGFRKTTAYTKSLLPWEIVNDCNIRILLGNEKSENAEDMLTEIQGHFVNNAMFRWLFPEVIPENLKKTTWSQRSEEHTSELQSRRDLVCRLLLEKKNISTILFINSIL